MKKEKPKSNKPVYTPADLPRWIRNYRFIFTHKECRGTAFLAKRIPTSGENLTECDIVYQNGKRVVIRKPHLVCGACREDIANPVLENTIIHFC